jgi:hypothetical protein
MPECCSSKPEPSEPPKSGLFAALSALLYSSCCWLPVFATQPRPILTCELTLIQLLLDGLSLGSASATFLQPLQHLKPALLALTVLLSVDTLRRRGLSCETLLRAALPVLVLLVPTALKAVRPANTNTLLQHQEHHHSCH